jgi:hypothetical protein
MNVMSGCRSAIGVSILGLWVSVACSSTSENGPSGQSGRAGAAQGGDAAGGGTAGGASAGKAGGNQQGGKTGGGVAGGGVAGTGTPEGGSDSAGVGGAGEGGAAGVPSTGPYQAVMGKLCPVESTIGVVELMGFPMPYVQVALYDRTDPWIGEAELETPTCGFHHYTAGGCPACDAGEVCSLAGACVPERRTIKDATLLVSVGAAERQYAANPTLGGIYSMLDIGNAASSYAMTLSWGQTEVNLGAMPVASATLANVAVKTEGDYAKPGALDATWKPSAQGAFVRSRIPINHHAGGPTFTECAAPESAGAFHADAAMIDPLAVQTGLEFQGLEHVFVAAATTPAGCIEFRFGAQILISPQ